MTDDLFRSRYLQLHQGKADDGKECTHSAEKLRLERLCRPTYATLQSHVPPSERIQTPPFTNRSVQSFRTPDESGALEQTAQRDTGNNKNVGNGWTGRRDIEREENEPVMLSGHSASPDSARILLSHDDIAAHGFKPSQTCYCYCPRGAAILQEDWQRWIEETSSYHPKSNSSRSTLCRHRKYREPLNKAAVNAVFHRLYSTKTVSSRIREMETGRLLSKHQYRSTDAFRQRSARDAPFRQPDSKWSDFIDESGEFMVSDYFRHYNGSHAMSDKMHNLSRPTVGSRLKSIGVCAVCEGYPEGSLLFRSASTNVVIKNKRELEILNQRIARPTVCSMPNDLMCIRAGEWKRAEIQQPPARSNMLTPSSLVRMRKTPHSARDLPLSSDLARVSNMRTATKRIYSTRCIRRNCKTYSGKTFSTIQPHTYHCC